MPAKRKLVYRLDAGMAASREPEVIHIILGYGVPWSRVRSKDLLFLGCTQGIPTFEFVVDRTERDWEVHGNAGHSSGASASGSTGGLQTESPDWQEHERGNPSGLSCVSEVDHPSKRVGKPLQQREVQRRNAPILHRPTGSEADEGADEVWR